MTKNLKAWFALSGAVMLVLSAAPASAIVYTPGTWQMFTNADYIVAPLAPTAFVQYGGMMGDESNGFVDNDPFTFSLTSEAVLRITDVFETGDRFKVWNWGNWLACTSASTWVLGGTEDDPDLAFATNPNGLPQTGYSTRSVNLAAGDYSLLFQNFAFNAGPPDPLPPGEGRKGSRMRTSA